MRSLSDSSFKNETITAIRIYADVPYKKGHNVKMPPFCFCCTHMYGGALLFIFNKAYLQIVDLMHTFLCSSWGINTSYGITCLTIFYCAFLGFSDNYLCNIQILAEVLPSLFQQYMSDPFQSHQTHILLPWMKMELNYLCVDFYYSVSEWCSELPCQRHAGPHHGRAAST